MQNLSSDFTVNRKITKNISKREILNSTIYPYTHNAPLRGKNTFAKIVEERKQQTCFCPA